MPTRHWRAAGALLVFASAAATLSCSWPDTDIVSTSTEGVGGYDVTATREANTLRASVCLSDPAHAGAVADRVLAQLMSRGYQSITVDMYAAPQTPVQRVVWTPTHRTDGPFTGTPPGQFCQTTVERSTHAPER